MIGLPEFEGGACLRQRCKGMLCHHRAGNMDHVITANRPNPAGAQGRPISKLTKRRRKSFRAYSERSYERYFTKKHNAKPDDRGDQTDRFHPRIILVKA